jgi:uncharacterized protein VirK/YbjX
MTARPEPPAAWEALRALPALVRAIYPAPGPAAALARSWLTWRVLTHFGLHRRLMQHMSSPPQATLLARQPHLLRKIHLAYPCRGLSPAQRLDWLMGHTRVATARLGSVLCNRLWDASEGLSCPVNLPQGQGQMSVRLCTAHRKHLREGDLTMELLDPFGTKLYALTFSFHPCAAGPEVLIGAVQGQMPLALTKHITKLCLGLRPPNLLLVLLQALALRLGVQRLRACGRARHIHHGSDREARVQFDYDGFWASVGGQADDQGFYVLPLRAQRRSHEDTPSHKRSQYRRRYAWMDELEDTVANWLDGLGAPSQPKPLA